MTSAKTKSQTFNLITSDVFARVFDRTAPINDIVGALSEHWEYSLEDRRPGPAILADGNVKPTDLDLACLLATLAKRKAVVILPKYLVSGTKRSTNGQTVISADNRRGQLLRLSSNKEYFSFSALVQDMNVLNADGSLGAPRYFHILGKDGRFHPGWDSIHFVPNAPENDFVKKYGLDVAGQIPFDRFVHENRWTSFYGQYYFLTKCVIDRLEAEAKVIRVEMKRLKTLDTKAETAPAHWRQDNKDESEVNFTKRTIAVPVFEVAVDAPVVGEFKYTATALDVAKEALKDREAALNDLRFAARVTELAWYKKNGQAGGYERAGFPAWIKGAKWETYRATTTSWRRLALGQLAVGQKDVALRYQCRRKNIEVAAH